MKKILSIILILGSLNCYAQDINKKRDEESSKIGLSTYIPEQIEKVPDAAKSILSNKLSQIVTQNGIGGNASANRFIITANINVMSKDITPTSPAMLAYSFDITLYIGDGILGTKFSSITTSVKGVGESETKAYISAIKNIKVTDPTYQTFIDNAKTKIINYYKTNCASIIKNAESLANQNNFEESLFLLNSIPNECSECYNQATKASLVIYQKKINRDCKLKLNEASTIWASTLNLAGAEQAIEILKSIEPNSSCFNEVKTLANKIEARVKELDSREWKYVLKEQSQESERINAIRDIGVAYGQGQKPVVYNVRGWW